MMDSINTEGLKVFIRHLAAASLKYKHGKPAQKNIMQDFENIEHRFLDEKREEIEEREQARNLEYEAMLQKLHSQSQKMKQMEAELEKLRGKKPKKEILAKIKALEKTYRKLSSKKKYKHELDYVRAKIDSLKAKAAKL